MFKMLIHEIHGIHGEAMVITLMILTPAEAMSCVHSIILHGRRDGM